MIGIFDSGVGGMTVARAIERLLPHVPLTYLGDIARSPYGPKSREIIRQYGEANCRFLIDQGASAIIIACNSAASVAAADLRERFAVPILDVICPAVEEAVRVSRHGRIGVIGTRATIDSRAYEAEIARRCPQAKVFAVACPLLVPLVEEGWLHKRETKMILRRYLSSLKQRQIDTLILGCTHYPLLSHLIAPRIGRRVPLIDSSGTTAARLQSFLASRPNLAYPEGHSIDANRYFVTDKPAAAEQMANRIFSRTIQLREIALP